jgi:hypothetical protein
MHYEFERPVNGQRLVVHIAAMRPSDSGGNVPARLVWTRTVLLITQPTWVPLFCQVR